VQLCGVREVPFVLLRVEKADLLQHSE
jgi:hypothetical protein